jgi:hypothetical protein
VKVIAFGQQLDHGSDRVVLFDVDVEADVRKGIEYLRQGVHALRVADPRFGDLAERQIANPSDSVGHSIQSFVMEYDGDTVSGCAYVGLDVREAEVHRPLERR